MEKGYVVSSSGSSAESPRDDSRTELRRWGGHEARMKIAMVTGAPVLPSSRSRGSGKIEFDSRDPLEDRPRSVRRIRIPTGAWSA